MAGMSTTARPLVTPMCSPMWSIGVITYTHTSMLQDWLRYARGAGHQGCRSSQGTVLLTDNQIITIEWNIREAAKKITVQA